MSGKRFGGSGGGAVRGFGSKRLSRDGGKISASSGGAADVRVASGKYRGRALRTPGSGTHPMGAREKLALFNMVSVEGARVLDAYAGSGALGIEALSRGAAEVVFVENNYKAAHIIEENLEAVEATGGDVEGMAGSDLGELRNGPGETSRSLALVEKVGSFAEREEYQGYFDVIIADPPYDKVDAAELGTLVPLLREDGVMAISTPSEVAEPVLDGMRVSSSHTYARARLTVYRKC